MKKEPKELAPFLIIPLIVYAAFVMLKGALDDRAYNVCVRETTDYTKCLHLK